MNKGIANWNFEPDCPFKDDCRSKGRRCRICKKNEKDDHFEPVPFRPYWVYRGKCPKAGLKYKG